MEREALKLALEALELVNIEFVCNGAHHAKKDRHELGGDCPVTARYRNAITAIKAALAQPEQYQQANPLGGPAKVFDAIADCIRAGDSLESVMATYGLVWAQDVPETGFGNMAQPAQEPVETIKPGSLPS